MKGHYKIIYNACHDRADYGLYRGGGAMEEDASLFTVFNFRNQYHFLLKTTRGVPTLVLLDKVNTFDYSKEPITYIIEEEVTSAIKVPSYLFESRQALDAKIQQKEVELRELEKRIESLKKEVNQI